jgi:serine phosphatase RsbU (regulator of sigma subunit)
MGGEETEPTMYASDATVLLQQLTGELDNFETIAKYLLPLPGDVPKLRGIDVWGGTLALTGVVGGDHIIYVDFKQRFDLDARIKHAAEKGRLEVVENLTRCQRTAGIGVIDVSGHRVTDAFLAAMLHQAFLLGSIYELDISGQITKRLFENLNTRFYKSSGENKFVSMIYGEISEDFRFRFLSAAQPFPAVFSNEHNRFMEVSPALCLSFPPLGMMPSLGIDRRTTESALGFTDRYQMNEWSLMGAGDILLLHTDGLAEHGKKHEHDGYFPRRLEKKLGEVKHLGAREIFEAVTDDLQAYADPSDDISIVVIKRT